MRRNLWSIGLVVSALVALLSAPSVAQDCNPLILFRTRHNFMVCLPGCPVVAVQWNWFTQAQAWPPLTTSINAGLQNYGVPSGDIKCADVSLFGPTGELCAGALACAQFQVDQIPGMPCIQGFHEVFGRVCVRCRGYGARAVARSSIVILCGQPDANGVIQWQPALNDSINGSSALNRDPVIVHLLNPETGETSTVTLFELESSGFGWEYQDVDGDDWGDSAMLIAQNPDRGYITLLKQSLDGEESRLILRYENGIVTESENSGEFSDLEWPEVGEPVPPEIPVPPTFDLPVEVPPGWILEQIEMGGGGEGGQTPPPPGDVNGDGCVDDADLLAVLFAFGQTGDLPEDVNGDGVVDDADLLIVLFNFGQGC